MIFHSITSLCRPLSCPRGNSGSNVSLWDSAMLLTFGLPLCSNALWQTLAVSYLSDPYQGVRMSQGPINQQTCSDISSLEAYCIPFNPSEGSERKRQQGSIWVESELFIDQLTWLMTRLTIKHLCLRSSEIEICNFGSHGKDDWNHLIVSRKPL